MKNLSAFVVKQGSGNMDDKLKRNLRITGIFMLITACLPCFYLLGLFLGFIMDSHVALLLCFAIAYWGYFLSGFIALVWGCITILHFPFEKIRVAFLFIAWLVLYPILCLAWVLLLALAASAIFK